MTDDAPPPSPTIVQLVAARDALDAAAVPVPETVSPPTSLGAVRALKTLDNRQWTPVECLRDCIADIESGRSPCDKLLILRVRTISAEQKDEVFNVGYHAANFKASEILAALECAKAQVLQEMGYLE